MIFVTMAECSYISGLCHRILHRAIAERGELDCLSGSKAAGISTSSNLRPYEQRDYNMEIRKLRITNTCVLAKPRIQTAYRLP